MNSNSKQEERKPLLAGPGAASGSGSVAPKQRKSQDSAKSVKQGSQTGAGGPKPAVSAAAAAPVGGIRADPGTSVRTSYRGGLGEQLEPGWLWTRGNSTHMHPDLADVRVVQR